MRLVLSFSLFFSLSVSSVFAQAVGLWVTSDAVVSAKESMPNTYSMEAFHDSKQFKDLAPKEFCRKFFDIYYDGRRKSWKSFQKGMELWSHTPQEPRANKELIEHDPVLLFNVHGTGYCGIQSGMMEGVYQSRPGGSIGKPAIEGRRWFLSGIVHSVADAYYDGKWHYYDIDIAGWAGDKEKDVWSVADVIKNPKGYYTSTSLRSPYFFKADSNGKWVEKIKRKGSYTFQDCLMVGHEMAMTLRPGETFTRYFDEASAGFKTEIPFTKKPQWKQKGYYELVYAPTKAQAKAASLSKDGALVIPIRVPYNIASSVVEASGTVSVSTDLGKTWLPLAEGGAVSQAVNHWDYLLKIEKGELQKITTRGFLHPAALPRVGSSKTKMKINKMADYHMLTYIPDFSSQEKLNQVATLTGMKYNTKKLMSLNGMNLTGRGELVIPVKAPAGAKIVKLGATIVGGTAAPADPKKYLELYIGEKGKSKLVERSTDCSGWGNKADQKVEHWQTNVNGAAKLEKVDEAEIKVKVHGYGRICSVRIYVGYVKEKEDASSGSLVVTHGFDNKTHEEKIDLAKLKAEGQEYEVGSGKSNQFIKMAVK